MKRMRKAPMLKRSHHRVLHLSLVTLTIFLLFVTALQRYFNPSTKTVKRDTKVVRVIDGDTIVLSDRRTIRYIGIDTPEQGQPFHDAARNFNRKLVQSRTVELEFDVERYDQYGRLLAYVFVRDRSGRRVFVNAELIRNGLARTYTKPPNVKYADLFVRLQEEARAQKRGLWSVYKPTRSPVIGSKKTMVFHRTNCPAVRRIDPQNRIRFPNAEAAFKRGFHPCRKCQP